QYRPVGGLTALLYAARDGCSDCADALIAAGADVNFPTPDGVTALMLALDNDHNDVAKLLMARGANPRLWDWWGRTALYIVIDRKEILDGIRRKGGAQSTTPAVLAWRSSTRCLQPMSRSMLSSTWNGRAAVETADASSILN